MVVYNSSAKAIAVVEVISPMKRGLKYRDF